MVTAASAFPGGVYPERDEQREGMLERAFTAAQFFTGGIGLRQRRHRAHRRCDQCRRGRG